jgi:hypothetical protein
MLLGLLLFVEARPWAMGAALGLLMLTRPDGALFAVLLIGLFPGRWRGRTVAAGAALATMLPWLLFSWIRLGSAVPDTLLLKLEQTAWGATTFADGLKLYGDRFGIATLTSLWPIALAPFAVLPVWRMRDRERRAVAALPLYGIGHFAAYAAMGVPPFHWYYTHQVMPIVLLGALGGAGLLRGLAASESREERWAANAATLLPAAGLVALLWVGGWSPSSAPIATNWATPEQYRAVGSNLRQRMAPADTISLHGEIGTVAYYCRCRVVDDFADLNRVNARIDDLQRRSTGLLRALLALNFLWRREETPLPPPTAILDFDPTDAGELPPGPGPDTLAMWDVSSPWVPHTRVTLRAIAYILLTVHAHTPDGTALTAEYQIITLAGGPLPEEREIGRWGDRAANAIPVAPFSTVLVRVRHPDYVTFEITVSVTTGTTEVLAVLTPRASP